jgi:hypothetical protein
LSFDSSPTPPSIPISAATNSATSDLNNLLTASWFASKPADWVFRKRKSVSLWFASWFLTALKKIEKEFVTDLNWVKVKCSSFFFSFDFLLKLTGENP